MLMRRIRNITVVLVAAIGLGGCSLLQPEVFNSSFWSNSPFQRGSTADLGLTELAKGNSVGAEGQFQKSLKANPRDVYALLGLAMIYQNNGQTTKSRQMYEAILAIRPDNNKRFMVWKGLSTRPVSEIASVNLALIESGGVLTSMNRKDGVQLEPVSREPVPISQSAVAASAPAKQETGLLRLSKANVNIVSRFKTMIALRNQGLITPQEYKVRRQANIGALLPLTSPPPAAGLDRPVPSTEQISGRLRAIGRGLELRAITIAQHTAERSMILDALMPAAPVSVANPGPPPRGLLEAADDVRRLEYLQQQGLITADEYARERAAIEAALQPPPPKQAALSAANGSAAKRAAGMTGPRPGVQLAAYRSIRNARRGWLQLKRAYKAELGNLRPDITKVNLGAKGIFYRLKAGPLASKGAARAICRRLKRRRQACRPAFVNAG